MRNQLQVGSDFDPRALYDLQRAMLLLRQAAESNSAEDCLLTHLQAEIVQLQSAMSGSEMVNGAHNTLIESMETVESRLKGLSDQLNALVALLRNSGLSDMVKDELENLLSATTQVNDLIAILDSLTRSIRDNISKDVEVKNGVKGLIEKLEEARIPDRAQWEDIFSSLQRRIEASLDKLLVVLPPRLDIPPDELLSRKKKVL
jgi:ABC-type transporter Mla subunit MlaD